MRCDREILRCKVPAQNVVNSQDCAHAGGHSQAVVHHWAQHAGNPRVSWDVVLLTCASWRSTCRKFLEDFVWGLRKLAHHSSAALRPAFPFKSPTQWRNRRTTPCTQDVDNPWTEAHRTTGNRRCCSASAFWKGAGGRLARDPAKLSGNLMERQFP